MTIWQVLFAEGGLSTEATLTGIIATLMTAMVSAISMLWWKVWELQKHRDKCERELAEARFQMISLNVEIERLQWVGEIGRDAIVVVDAITDMIREWSPDATAMFQHPQKEALGKSATLIIPPEYRDKHLAAMRQLVKDRHPPARGPHKVWGLRKDGTKIPLFAFYSGWTDGDQHFVSATFRARSTSGDSDGSKSKDPENGTGSVGGRQP